MRRVFSAFLTLFLMLAAFVALCPGSGWADGYAGPQPKEESFRDLAPKKPARKKAAPARRKTPTLSLIHI